MYTSLKLSKLLADNGFEGESEYRHYSSNGKNFVKHKDFAVTHNGIAYDILNDLCVCYAKEIFEDWNYCTYRVFEMLQNSGQDEAEEYIWENCLFNPNNK